MFTFHNLSRTRSSIAHQHGINAPARPRSRVKTVKAASPAAIGHHCASGRRGVAAEKQTAWSSSRTTRTPAAVHSWWPLEKVRSTRPLPSKLAEAHFWNRRSHMLSHTRSTWLGLGQGIGLRSGSESGLGLGSGSGPGRGWHDAPHRYCELVDLLRDEEFLLQ